MEEIATVEGDVFVDNFKLIDDFERSKSALDSTSVGVYEFSTNGVDLVVFQNSEKDYYVFDIWLFGETGQIRAVNWTDRI